MPGTQQVLGECWCRKLRALGHYKLTCFLSLYTKCSTLTLQWSQSGGWKEGRQGDFLCRSSQTACLISIC